VEHPRLVADRIADFTKLVGRENVIAGTDCGFAQGETILRVHPQVKWAKLESLVAGARRRQQGVVGALQRVPIMLNCRAGTLVPALRRHCEEDGGHKGARPTIGFGRNAL
jgi:hypothetical protein